MSKMCVLNIHGYHGRADNSLYQALVANNYDVLSYKMDYDGGKSPRALLDMLEAQIRNPEQGITAIAGTSLGGFYALLLSIRFDLPVLVVNPALLPAVQLPTLGKPTHADLREYFELQADLVNVDRRLVSTIVGEADEIIDTLSYTELVLKNSRFFSVPNGKHSGSTLPLEDIIQNHGEEIFHACYIKDLYGFQAP